MEVLRMRRPLKRRTLVNFGALVFALSGSIAASAQPLSTPQVKYGFCYHYRSQTLYLAEDFAYDATSNEIDQAGVEWKRSDTVANSLQRSQCLYPYDTIEAMEAGRENLLRSPPFPYDKIVNVSWRPSVGRDPRSMQGKLRPAQSIPHLSGSSSGAVSQGAIIVDDGVAAERKRRQAATEARLKAQTARIAAANAAAKAEKDKALVDLKTKAAAAQASERAKNPNCYKSDKRSSCVSRQ